jgi:putative phosphotransacetylase
MGKIIVPVETSARHVHLTKEDMAKLFGEGAFLTPKRYLSQPGQFLANERVSIVGERGRMDNVAVLGPERKATQIEISLTDARALGVTAPVRESGDIKESGSIRIEGPAGSIDVPEGVIAAKRHIHFTPEDAEKYGLKDKQIVSVRIDGVRSIVFNEVVVRVCPNFATYMHIDVDEANAAGFSGKEYGEVIA